MNKNKKREFKTDRVNPSSFKEYKVKEEIGLLDFLLKTLTNQSRNNIKSLLKNHQVAVDGAPISQFDFKLSKDDILSFATKNNIILNNKELDYIFNTIKNDYKILLSNNYDVVFQNANNYIREDNLKKIYNLFLDYRNKYQNYLI